MARARQLFEGVGPIAGFEDFARNGYAELVLDLHGVIKGFTK